MEMVSTVEVRYKVGAITPAIIADARHAGLSETGIHALVEGDVKGYKAELDALTRSNPGSLWACWSGYNLWFNSASAAERADDLKVIGRALESVPFTCARCGHTWRARVRHPKSCPGCNSPYWNKPRQRL